MQIPKALILILLCGFSALFAANPLSNLPSAPGPAVAQLEALGDNAWLNLGSPAADPVWGKCRGRSWGARQTYAPDLQGGFFSGEGPHGAVKPDGHYNDDVFFYDVNQNRWICVYPGAHCATLNLHLDANGFEVDANGDFIPVAFLGHNYGNATYIPPLRRYMLVWSQEYFWANVIPQRWDWLDQSLQCVQDHYYGCVGPVIQAVKHPFYWDVDAGKWERPFSTGAGPDYLEGALIQYIPTLNKVFFNSALREVWLYDPSAHTWQKLMTHPSFWSNQQGCYDSKRGRVYAGQGSSMAYFNFGNNTWTLVNAGGKSFPSANSVVINYDSANDVVLYHNARSTDVGEWGGIGIYDPAGDTWSHPSNTFPGGVSVNYMNYNSFYDSRLNVHFFYVAGDGSDNGTMLAYRYKRAAGSRVERRLPRAAAVKPGCGLPDAVYDLSGRRIIAPRQSGIYLYRIHGRIVKRIFLR